MLNYLNLNVLGRTWQLIPYKCFSSFLLAGWCLSLPTANLCTTGVSLFFSTENGKQYFPHLSIQEDFT